MGSPVSNRFGRAIFLAPPVGFEHSAWLGAGGETWRQGKGEAPRPDMDLFHWARHPRASAPIEIGGRIPDDAERIAPVVPAREGVHNRLMAGCIQLEHGPRARCAAAGGCSVQVAGRIADRAAVGIPSAGAISVTRLSAQASAPARAKVDRFLKLE